jgi:hypothetical protein
MPSLAQATVVAVAVNLKIFALHFGTKLARQFFPVCWQGKPFPYAGKAVLSRMLARQFFPVCWQGSSFPPDNHTIYRGCWD